MKKLLVLMLAMLTAVTSPEQFKMNSICPRQYRLSNKRRLLTNGCRPSAAPLAACWAWLPCTSTCRISRPLIP